MNDWRWAKAEGDLIVFDGDSLKVGMLIQKFDHDYWLILINGDLTPYPEWCMEKLE
jgi:hypothetical protein